MFFERLFHLPFRIKLRTFFLAVIALCFGFGFYVAKTRSDDTVTTLAKLYVDQLNQNTIEATTAELIPAVQITESSARMIQEGTISISNPGQITNYLHGALKTYPQLNAFYFGDKFGNFYMVKKLPNGNHQLKIIMRSLGLQTQTTKLFTNTGIPISNDVSSIMEYDPRNRPWFIGAKTLEQRFWTDVYVFYTGNVPGVSASFPTFDDNNQFYGAFGIDIALGNVSKILRSHKLSSTTRLFILDRNNSVVAHPDMEQKLSKKTATLSPLHISDIQDPIITTAFKTYERLKVGVFTMTVNKKEFIVSIQPFPEYFGQRWLSVLIVSKKEALAHTQTSNRNNGLWIVLSLAALLYSIAFLKHNVTNPLKNEALQHESSISEIKKLSEKI